MSWCCGQIRTDLDDQYRKQMEDSKHDLRKLVEEEVAEEHSREIVEIELRLNQEKLSLQVEHELANSSAPPYDCLAGDGCSSCGVDTGTMAAAPAVLHTTGGVTRPGGALFSSPPIKRMKVSPAPITAIGMTPRFADTASKPHSEEKITGLSFSPRINLFICC